MNELEIIYLPPSALKPYEHNIRLHDNESIEAIKQSIINNGGFNDPIGIWGPDNIIVEGHGRQKAALDLEISEVPCVRLDSLTEEQMRFYVLAHNRCAELSGWSFEILSKELDSLKGTGCDLSKLRFPDFDTKAIDNILMQSANKSTKRAGKSKSYKIRCCCCGKLFDAVNGE